MQSSPRSVRAMHHLALIAVLAVLAAACSGADEPATTDADPPSATADDAGEDPAAEPTEDPAAEPTEEPMDEPADAAGSTTDPTPTESTDEEGPADAGAPAAALAPTIADNTFLTDAGATDADSLLALLPGWPAELSAPPGTIVSLDYISSSNGETVIRAEVADATLDAVGAAFGEQLGTTLEETGAGWLQHETDALSVSIRPEDPLQVSVAVPAVDHQAALDALLPDAGVVPLAPEIADLPPEQGPVVLSIDDADPRVERGRLFTIDPADAAVEAAVFGFYQTALPEAGATDVQVVESSSQVSGTIDGDEWRASARFSDTLGTATVRLFAYST